MEWYTRRSDNVAIVGGELVMKARTTTAAQRQSIPGCDKNTDQCLYTSARVRTFGKFSVGPAATSKNKKRAVRIEARVMFPEGLGLWPSIYMLPAQSPANCSGCGAYGAWAASGAITIAQSANTNTTATGGILFGGVSPDQTSSTYTAPLRTTSSGYHRFTLDWTTTKMRWSIDGKKVFEAKSGKGGKDPNGWFTTAEGAGPNAPFDKQFYILMSLAVGGTGSGATPEQVAATLSQPKEMRADYIRVCTST